MQEKLILNKMLPLRVDEVDDYDQEDLELYSWWNEEDQYHSRIEYDSNSVEDEEEEDEDDHDENFTSNSWFDRN